MSDCYDRPQPYAKRNRSATRESCYSLRAACYDYACLLTGLVTPRKLKGLQASHIAILKTSASA